MDDIKIIKRTVTELNGIRVRLEVRNDPRHPYWVSKYHPKIGFYVHVEMFADEAEAEACVDRLLEGMQR